MIYLGIFLLILMTAAVTLIVWSVLDNDNNFVPDSLLFSDRWKMENGLDNEDNYIGIEQAKQYWKDKL